MKKLILSLLIFCSVLLQAQIQIPQVVGLPSALASKATKTELNLKQTVFTGICQEQFLTENDIIIDNTALTLTIATVKNGQSISALNPICFYTDGNGVAVKHEKSTPVVFNFTNTDGVWYFYFNSSGNPIATQTSWSDFSTMASVYRFYWNSSLPVSDRRVIESIEYHKNDISWSDHVWKHSEGTKYLSGFNISHNATVSATPNANGSNAVVTLSSGSNIDDNMEYSVTHAASGSVKFTQNLGTGLLPATSGKFICISNDASLRLQKIPATDFPFLWNTTTNIPQYLTPTGVRKDVSNGYFFVYYIYALQDPRYGEAIKIKSAETQFASSTLAAAHNWEQLQAIFPTLRDGEIRLLYKLTFEYKSAYDIGTKKAALRTVDDLRKQKTTTTATAGGLLPATSVVVSPIGNIASTNVQSALQELDSEKQPVGTYSTDIHSNITALNAVIGTNTGDETLSSIKTTLGAATPVSDGYLRYQDFAYFSDIVSNATHTGDVTGSKALTLATVNSNIGTFNNVTINAKGLATAGSNVSYLTGITESQVTTALGYTPWWSSNHPTTLSEYGITDAKLSEPTTFSTQNASYVAVRTSGRTVNQYYEFWDSGIGWADIKVNEVYSGGGSYKVWHAGNLTNNLSTNYIPKWNGSSMVNSLISDDGNITLIAKVVQLNDNHQIQWGNSTSMIYGNGANGTINLTGNIKVDNGTTSTSPTTGALVVNGGIGANHVRANNFYGNGSNLTGVQLPITLTTNGTSGAATFSGNVLNVPNYTQSATGSSYSCTFTNILNTSLALGLMSDYTTVGGVISIAIHGGVSSTGSGKCTFRLSLPTAASPSYKFVVTASDASKTTGRNIFVEATASNYVDVSFLATAAGEIIEFTIMGNGHQ